MCFHANIFKDILTISHYLLVSLILNEWEVLQKTPDYPANSELVLCKFLFWKWKTVFKRLPKKLRISKVPLLL